MSLSERSERQLQALIGRVEDLENRLKLPPPNALIDGSSGTWKSVPTVSADKITLTTMSGAYNDIQDWANNTQSSGKISGGTFTDNTDGTVKIGSGTGLIRTSNDELGEVRFFSWDEHAIVTLTDNSTNYIIITYSKDPVVSATVTKADGNNRNVILLGKIYRDGTDLHFAEAGMVITEATKRVLTYLTQVHGEVIRASGYVVAESGERYLTTTDGVLFAGLTRLTTSGIDTTGSDTFETYYYDGDLGTPAWVEGSASQIDNANWNDVAIGLDTLTANRYCVHWVYGDPDGHVMVVYGQGDYTLAGAESANPPSSLPDHIADFAFIAAKIIVQEGEANLYTIDSAYETQFTPSGAADHGELTGLTDYEDHPGLVLVAGDTMTGKLSLHVSGGAAQDIVHYRDATDTVDLVLRYNGDGFEFRTEVEGGGNLLLSFTNSGKVGVGVSPNQEFTVEGAMSLKEQASAGGDIATYGQLWIKSDAPNILMFTDDAGADFTVDVSAV